MQRVAGPLGTAAAAAGSRHVGVGPGGKRDSQEQGPRPLWLLQMLEGMLPAVAAGVVAEGPAVVKVALCLPHSPPAAEAVNNRTQS